MSFTISKTIKKAYLAYQSISLSIYYASFGLIIIGFLFSRGMMSIGFIAFIANWILEGNYHEKWQLIKQNKAKLIISAIFAIHLLGLIHTKNLDLGLLELKIKLPLLLPIFYFSSKKLLNSIKINFFLALFLIATFAASLFGFIRFEFFTENQTLEDLNQLSLIDQNIRLSLLVNLSIFISLYYLFRLKNENFLMKSVLLIVLLWLVVFIYLINSFTGHISFVVLLFFSFFFVIKSRRKIAYFLLFFLVLGLGTLTLYVNIIYQEFYKIVPIDLTVLEKETQNGNVYYHNLESKRIENGHFIDIYISNDELKKEWNKVSGIDYKSKDKKGHDINQTLIRYLTSKGLRKDSVDFQKLTNKDIDFIENGCSNYKYTKKYSLEARIYNILWQLHTYHQTGNATAQSISQRIEFLKVAKNIITKHFWFGVGPGDVMEEFSIELSLAGSKLEKTHHNRVHNQYIVEFTALGIFGFLAFIFITFYPVFKFRVWNNYLFSVFYLIVLLSYFTDNNLETQLGISFYSFFYCLLFPEK